ncbi:hypothetical protein FDB30_11385 [Clostridium botulinum]|uniref:hypothetical protein n=1 Tax=Clostridium botulinum TaxID=1491 RepID=UPI00077349EC|nr:hypothetical protein [Clostridium botulinum]MBN1048300.1 hypothetical protein [Clostridium botulinum]MBN1077295.1 hypothetical protein [Clostridium botulinum]NFE84752.1 hypothetical protein [Clostridium botulinum]NFG38488.1 hypothetical protein [Clostridium botulinum]NFN28271.1 hypothetical protein [Clostridium botulinum]
MIQILSEFERRTEYKILKLFAQCEIINLKNLKNGKLIIPGFVLNKMKEEELKLLNLWLSNRSNHLIIVPAWIELDIGKLINSTVPLKVLSIEESYYEDIPVRYKIETLAKDVLFQDNNVYGVNYRKNTGTALVTVTTLPLLDYKLIHQEKKFKEVLNELLSFGNDSSEELQEKSMGIILDSLHINLLILKAGGVDLSNNLSNNLSKKVFKYFYNNIENEILEEKLKELNQGGFIINNSLSEKSEEVITKNRLQTFIDVVRRKEMNSNGW